MSVSEPKRKTQLTLQRLISTISAQLYKSYQVPGINLYNSVIRNCM